MTRTIVTLAVAALLAAVTLTGCGETGSWLVQEDADGRVLLVAGDHHGERPNAYVQGELTLVGGTCFGLAGEFGDATVGFPHGTTIVYGAGLDIPGFGPLAMGDHIEGPGGTLSLEAIGFAGDLPAECRPDAVSQLNPFD